MSIVEDAGFVELLGVTTANRYCVLSRKNLSRCILPELYLRAVAAVRSRVQQHRETHKCNVLFGDTTDAWTSSANTSYVTYTLHMVREYTHSSSLRLSYLNLTLLTT